MGPLAWGSQLWFRDLLDSARVGIWGMEHRQKRHGWEEGKEGGKVSLVEYRGSPQGNPQQMQWIMKKYNAV